MNPAPRLAGLIFLVVLFIAPLLLASNRGWAWAPEAGLVALAVLLWAAAAPGNRAGSRLLSAELALAMAAMIIVCGYGLLQGMTWFGSPLGEGSLPPIQEALGRQLPRSLALDAEAARTATMKLLMYGGVFLLATQLGRDRHFADLTGYVIVASAVLVTAYGALMEVDNRSCIAITFIKRPLETGYPCPFSGTFINANNYATFAGMAALVCIARLQASLIQAHVSKLTTRMLWRRRLIALGGPNALLCFALVVTSAGLALSGSRGALGAFACAVAAMVGLYARFHSNAHRAVIKSAIVTVIFILFMVVLSGSMTVERAVLMLSDHDTGRLALYVIATEAIATHPFAGWGLGSFPSVYPILQPSNLALNFDKAHNVYLETAVEIGIPMAILWFSATAVLVWRCIRGVAVRHRDAHLPAIGFGCSVFVGLHSLVDFSVQMPAVALAYSALLGIAWTHSRSSRELEGT
jgi:O-antigen ligase